MAICPFATSYPITGAVGSFLGGLFRIVHHTTEGPTAQGAFEQFRRNRSDPHFTVDEHTIYQHIDTAVAARSLRNDTGKPPETNRWSAVQIEVVGFAHLPKSMATLRNIAKLCRWIERNHAVARVWPNGYPKVAVNGQDPGEHNRNAATWASTGGHYGHCHVPENTHWDPAYTRAEVDVLMDDRIRNSSRLRRQRRKDGTLRDPTREEMMSAISTMPDH